MQILLQHYCHDQILLTPFSFYKSPFGKGKWNKSATWHHRHLSISFILFIYFISFSFPSPTLSKFCYFKVTELVIFVLFKAPLRNQVKLAPLEQALLFKSQRCSNVLAIFSHSFPMGHLGEAPVTAPAKSRKCSMTWHSQSLIPRAVRKPWETLPGTQDSGCKHCTSSAATVVMVAMMMTPGKPGDSETQRAFWGVSSQLQHNP